MLPVSIACVSHLLTGLLRWPAHVPFSAPQHTLQPSDLIPGLTAAGLEMDNARLRAEIATHIAAACIRELSAPYPPQLGTQASPATAAPALAATAAAAAAAAGASAHSATASPTASSSSSGRLPSRTQSQAGMVHATAALPAAPPAMPSVGTDPQQSQGERLVCVTTGQHQLGPHPTEIPRAAGC